MAKEKPILFTAEMVRAIKEGRKTVTRRVITNIPAYYTIGNKPQSYGPDDYAFFDRADPVGTYPTLASPRYNVGDLLWVKEAWRNYTCNKGYMCIQFKADEAIYHGLTPYGDNGEIVKLGDICKHGFIDSDKWRSPQFMPKKFARDWLEVVSVRAERSDEGLWVWRYEFKEYLRQGSEDNGRIHETT